MNDTFLLTLKQKLETCILDLSNIRSLFSLHPETDFSRERKITFPDLVNMLLQMESKSLPNELMEYFNHDLSGPTTSAFIQQRAKFAAEGMAFLLFHFNDVCKHFHDKTMDGYRLLAADGSDINIARNPDDEDTFIKQGERGYNQLHINALYDILNHVHVDIDIQGEKKLHERLALNHMASRYHGLPAIFIADRGYESWNVFAHFIEHGQKFVVRMKDISSNGILSAWDLPDDEFDVVLHTTLTRRHTKETLQNPDTYTILQPYTDFDFLDDTNRYYEITIRVVRFQLPDGSYQCVATNLDADEFPSKKIKMVYNARWGEETSFRELKYTVGLVDFHSRKKEFILQEIYARLILYNFCEMAATHAADTKPKNPGTKHVYRINFATTVNICRAYLRHGGDETDYMQLIQKHLTPIRANRSFPRNVRAKTMRNFMYRAA